MDERRTNLALFFCVVIAMVYMQMVFTRRTATAPAQNAESATPQSSALQSAAPAAQTGAPQQIAQAPGTGAAPAALPQQSGTPSQADFDATPNIVVQTNLAVAELEPLGGRLASLRLKNYRVTEDRPELLDLVSHKEGHGYPLGVYVGSLSDASVRYELASSSVPVQNGVISLPQGDAVVQLTGTLPDGRKIEKRFTFSSDSYLVKIDLAFDTPAAEPAYLEWSRFVADPKSAARVHKEQFTLLSAEGKLRHVAVTEAAPTLADAGSNVWAALADTYFMSSLIPPAPQGVNTKMGRDDDIFLVRVAGAKNGGEFTIYSGPKDDRILRDIGFQLNRSIDLGIFSFMAVPFLDFLRFFFKLLGNYGLSIIALTLIIKFLMLPLTRASFKSMRAMQDIQPEMKALRERIKDPNQLNQEVLALYKRKGINPMGGCLPMILQLPVFLGLYNALGNSIEMRHAPFALWITDLSSPERLEVGGMGIPVMIILMGISMFLQQYTSPSSADPAQRKAMMLTPIIFTVMFVIYPFPAGLVLYWLVSNLISIIQQMYLRREHGSPVVATAIASVAIFITGFVLTLLPRF